MANRGMSSAMIAALSADEVRLVHFIRMHLGYIDVTATTAHKPIYATLEGDDSLQTYQDQGILLSVPAITETIGLRNETVTFVVGFAEQTVAAQLLTESPINKRIDMYVGALDYATGDLVSSPLWLFKGYIATFTMVDDTEKGNSVISITAANHWADFDRKNGYRTNDRHQQSARYHPGDKGFVHCSKPIKDLQWGAPD